MIAVETTLVTDDLPDSLDALHSRISATVPAGVGKDHNHDADIGAFITANDTVTKVGLGKRAAKQMGTWGSGNHFIEMCLDETDTVWVVPHSGSRGVGNRLAMRHIAKAKGIMKRFLVELPDPDPVYFIDGTAEFGAHITDLMCAQEYASRSRETTINVVIDAMRRGSGFPVFNELRRINCHDNYTAKEHTTDAIDGSPVTALSAPVSVTSE